MGTDGQSVLTFVTGPSVVVHEEYGNLHSLFFRKLKDGAFTFLNLFLGSDNSVCLALGYVCTFLVPLDGRCRSDCSRNSSVGIATR
jgi:hypothetical protein